MAQGVEKQRLEQQLRRLRFAGLGAKGQAAKGRELCQVEYLLTLPGKLAEKA